MNALTPQQQIDLKAEQLKVALAPYVQNQEELRKRIDWAKHNAKAIEAWQKGKTLEMLMELYQAENNRTH